MRNVAVFVVAAFMLVSCSTRIDEELVKEKIKVWWEAEGIEDVVVESFTKSQKTIIFNARLVVSGDTLERMTYEFRKGMKGWELGRGPFAEKQKHFLLENVGLVNIDFFQRQRELVEMFKGVMDMYGSYTGGRYPPLLNTKINAIPEYQGDKGEETVLDMIRTFLEGELPFVDARGDTNEWLSEYRGKVVYFPLQKEDSYALQYVVKAGLDTCFVDDVLNEWKTVKSLREFLSP